MSLLAQQLKIRGKAMRNRIAMPPMANHLADESGAVVPEHNEHYRIRAKDGVALIIVEHSYVHISGRMRTSQLAVDRDELVDGLATLVSSIKDQGALAVIQITHAGSMAAEVPPGGELVAPSPIINPKARIDVMPRELTPAELEELKEQYVKAAVRAERAGFDAVELHGAHGYLLNEFISPLTNQRTDGYGGSEEGRAKFPLEVTAAVKSALADDTILMYRLGTDDFLPGGLTIETTAPFSAQLEEKGVDLIDISGGFGNYAIVDEKPGYFRNHGRAIKKLVSIPVMVTGGIKTPEFAEEILQSGDADIIGIGRKLLKNSKWASEALKALSGKG